MISARALALAAALIASPGCSVLRLEDATIEGTVLLEDPTVSLAGTRVVLDGEGVTLTDSRGAYAFIGSINGDDTFQLLFQREGFVTATHTGRIEHDLSDDVAASYRVPTVVLETE